VFVVVKNKIKQLNPILKIPYVLTFRSLVQVVINDVLCSVPLHRIYLLDKITTIRYSMTTKFFYASASSGDLQPNAFSSGIA
jgi:hypothetical protein